LITSTIPTARSMAAVGGRNHPGCPAPWQASFGEAMPEMGARSLNTGLYVCVSSSGGWEASHAHWHARVIFIRSAPISACKRQHLAGANELVVAGEGRRWDYK
jgi:hypothetical protein